MWWFRRSSDLNQTTARFSDERDVLKVSRLFRDGYRRYYGLVGDELPVLLTDGYAIVMENQKEIVGVVVVGHRMGQATWLRGLALSRGIDVATGTKALLQPLHQALAKQYLKHIFYAGEESADTWLLPVLKQVGYVQDTEVIVFEKRSLHIPAYGNQIVFVRKAQRADVDTIWKLDHACFESHWVKDTLLLSSALSQEGLFVVAEIGSRIVGYVFATSHFGGKLIHLVRIAVNPYQRGMAIGVRLLSEVVTYARAQQSEVITLNTQSHNEPAKRLYQWFGFVPTGESQPVLRYDLDD